MPRSNRLKLSLAGTAAVALASLPLGITPASAARVTEGTTSNIGVIEELSDASPFNQKTQDGQSLAQIMADEEGRGRGSRGNAWGSFLGVLQKLLESLGIVFPSQVLGGGANDGVCNNNTPFSTQFLLPSTHLTGYCVADLRQVISQCRTVGIGNKKD